MAVWLCVHMCVCVCVWYTLMQLANVSSYIVQCHITVRKLILGASHFIVLEKCPFYCISYLSISSKMCSSGASCPSFSTFIIDTVFITCPTVAWQWLILGREVTITTVSKWALLFITLGILCTACGGIERGIIIKS